MELINRLPLKALCDIGVIGRGKRNILKFPICKKRLTVAGFFRWAMGWASG